jgi:hypothetical protein
MDQSASSQLLPTVLLACVGLSGWGAFFLQLYRHRKDRPSIRVRFSSFMHDEGSCRFVLKGRADNVGKQLARACEVHFDVRSEVPWSSILAGRGTWQDRDNYDYAYRRSGPPYPTLNPGDWREFWAAIEWDPRGVLGLGDLGPVYLFPVGAKKGRYVVLLVVTYGNNSRAHAAAEIDVRRDLGRDVAFPEVSAACEANFRLSWRRRVRLCRLVKRVNYRELVGPT